MSTIPPAVGSQACLAGSLQHQPLPMQAAQGFCSSFCLSFSSAGVFLPCRRSPLLVHRQVWSLFSLRKSTFRPSTACKCPWQAGSGTGRWLDTLMGAACFGLAASQPSCRGRSRSPRAFATTLIWAVHLRKNSGRTIKTNSGVVSAAVGWRMRQRPPAVGRLAKPMHASCVSPCI